MAHEQNGQNQLPNFKEWVPEKLRILIYLLFLTGFQFSNGMYFASMGQMAGDLSVTHSDVMMMGHAVLVGLTMYFPLAFRLKFRFTNRSSLLIAASGLLLCNLIVPQLHSVPLLILTCFIAGFLRLYGTFECFSNLLPKITPTYNYAVFLSFVFFVVLGVIQVFDVAIAHIVYYFNWRYVHYLAIGVLLLVILGAYTLMRPFRSMPKMPLYGIDWIGMVLWSIFILSLIFVAEYGEQYNWLDSNYIRAAIGFATLALAANVWRMTNLRHPFIEIKALMAKNLWYLLLLFLFLDILLSAQNVLQNTYTSAILHYDYINEVSLKWFGFIGIALGALFSWYVLTKRHWPHKRLMFIGMSFIMAYIACMYTLISTETNMEKLYLPLIFSGFGHVVIFISLTVYAQATVPFKNYFQVLCVLGFIRTGLASPLGGAIYSHAMKGILSKHLAFMGSNVNAATQLPYPDLASTVGTEAMLATLQELFGWSFIFGILLLMAILTSRFKKNINLTIPSMAKKYQAFAKK